MFLGSLNEYQSNSALYAVCDFKWKVCRLLFIGMALLFGALASDTLHAQQQTMPVQQPDPLIQVEYGTHEFRSPITRRTLSPLHMNLTYAPVSHYFYGLLQYEGAPLHRFDLRTGERTFFSLDSIPLTVRRYMEDPSTTDLLFWDWSVGKVYRLTSEGQTTRLDQSFTHRNQYGHAPWIGMDGTIYAFGGYGLFTGKNIVTFFNQNIRSWTLLPISDNSVPPPPQSGALAIPNTDRTLVYIIGRKELYQMNPNVQNQRSGLGIWSLEPRKGQWHYHGQIPWNRSTNVNSSLTMHPSGDFFLMPVIGTNSSSHDIIAYFPLTGRTIALSQLGIRTASSDGIADVFWSDHDQAYYFVHSSWLVQQDEKLLTFNRITIPDPQAFVKAYGSAEVAAAEIPIVRYVFIVLLLTAAIALQWYRKRREILYEEGLQHDEQDGLSDVDSHDDVPTQKVIGSVRTDEIQQDRSIGDGFVCQVTGPDHQGAFRILTRRGIPIFIDTDNEVRLLALLVQKARIQPGTFVSSDEVDALLIPHHPSADYIRRVRNITVNRLSAAFDETGDNDLILKQKMKTDKRKVEYRLSEKVQV